MAYDGFPFSLVLFSRLCVVEFRWFPPPPPRCPRCIDYWTDALTHNVTLCLNTCSTDQSLITSNTRLESSKTAKRPIYIIQGKSGVRGKSWGNSTCLLSSKQFAGISRKSNEVFEYMCLPLWCCRPPLYCRFFNFIRPEFRHKDEMKWRLAVNWEINLI